MDGNSSSDWNEDIEVGSLGDLLECINTQFIPNHSSNHYQSGYVPASNLAWPLQHSQPHHMLPMDPSLNASPLGPQVGLNTLRSYSVNQSPFPDMGCSQTPLLRSSSDLGLRLNQFSPPRSNYPECELQEILDHHVETLDSTVFYSDNSHLTPPNSSPYQHIPVSKCDEMVRNQNAGMHYASYIADPDMLQNEQANNFSTKLSNFTASLGTWLSPLDQIRSDYNHSVQISDASANSSMMQENLKDNAQISSTIDSQGSEILSSSFSEMKPNTKPRYSDVLSKAPIQEGKSLNSCHKSGNVQSNVGFKSREQPLKGTSSKSNKHRNSVGMGRSNSPNLGSVVNNNNLTDSATNLKYSKFDSKVGLDNFDLPASVPNYNSNATNSISNNNNNINNNFNNNNENNDRSKKRTSITSDDSSPCHQSKKGSKFDKNLSDKLQQDCGIGEIENIHCDKLNNHTLSTQQKQTPKRTTYINNNFTSFSASISTSKTNNTDNSSTSSSSYQNRKSFSVPKEDEAKAQFENSGNSSTGKNILNASSSSSPSSTSAVPSPSSGGCGSSLSSIRSSGGGGSNFKSGRYSSNRLEKNKDNQSKRNLASKRKKDASPYTHSELLMTGWTMCLLWLGKAGIWLLSLIVDVAQMSYRLLLHFSLSLLEKGKLYQVEAKHAFKFYWTKAMSKLFRKKSDGKKGGRNDRKSPFGLESNIPLPTTGEEAMKRLLACRGKDPYSILGVTRDCTDDDIKKYYKRQAFLVHPDKNKQPGAEEAFKILAHAFEIIGEPERREQYNTKLAEEAHLEGATGELASLLNLLKEKLEEAANTIRCTNCNKRHRRTKLPRPVYAARHCAECQIRHAAREGDIWAESWHIGLWWKYYACMEGAIYDISEWASCQRENLKHLQANTHSVQYRIVSGKKNAGGKNSTPECPTDPELEEFFNNLCRERFGQDFVPGTTQSGGTSSSTDVRKRRGKKKK